MKTSTTNKKVSFDFDSTLDKTLVQDYAKSLINKGYDIWVITSRYPPGTNPLYSKRGIMVEIDNSDLFEVTDKLGITRDKIIFTSHQLKSEVINDFHLEFLFHLDDDWVEINHINSETTTRGISCFGTSGWKQKCNKLLKT